MGPSGADTQGQPVSGRGGQLSSQGRGACPGAIFTEVTLPWGEVGGGRHLGRRPEQPGKAHGGRHLTCTRNVFQI